MMESTDNILADSGESPPTKTGGAPESNIQKMKNCIKKNVIIIAVVIAILVLLFFCFKGKSGYRNKPIRSDDQSDWSVENEVQSFITFQEKLIQKIKMAESSVEDYYK